MQTSELIKPKMIFFYYFFFLCVALWYSSSKWIFDSAVRCIADDYTHSRVVYIYICIYILGFWVFAPLYSKTIANEFIIALTLAIANAISFRQ